MLSLAENVKAEDHVLFSLFDVARMSEEAVGADDVVFAISREVLESETDTSRSAHRAGAVLLRRLDMNDVVEIANREAGHHRVDQLSDAISSTGLQDVIHDQRGSVDDDARRRELLDAANQNAAVEAVVSESDVHSLEGTTLVLAVHLVEVEGASLLLDGVVVREVVGVVSSVQVELHLCKAMRLSIDHESLIKEELSRDALELVLELFVLEGSRIKIQRVEELLIKRAGVGLRLVSWCKVLRSTDSPVGRGRRGAYSYSMVVVRKAVRDRMKKLRKEAHHTNQDFSAKPTGQEQRAGEPTSLRMPS